MHCASRPPSCLFSKLSESAATEPTLSCLSLVYCSAYVSHVPRLASTTPQGFLALLHFSSALLRPRSRLDYFSHFRPFSHRRSHFLFVLGFPPLSPFSFSIRPRPRHRLCARSYPRPRSHFRSQPRPRTLFPVRRTHLPPRYNAGVQIPGIANGAIGCTQAPSSVCRDDDVCGMKVPAVKEKYVYVQMCIFHIIGLGLNHVH